MVDETIERQIDEIYHNLEVINKLMADLDTKNVEVKILYRESEKGKPPRLDFWRATEHVDYLEKYTNK